MDVDTAARAASVSSTSPALLATAAVIAIFGTALAGALAPLLVALPSPRLIRLGNSFAAGILVAAALVHLQPAAHDAVLALRPANWKTPLPLDGVATLLGVCIVFLLDLALRARAARTACALTSAPATEVDAPLAASPKRARPDMLPVALAPTPATPLLPATKHAPVPGCPRAHAHAGMGVSGVLAGSLCVHALMEGLSLGATLEDARQFSVLAAAVLAHKLFAALALGASLAGAVARSGDAAGARRVAVGTGVAFAALTPAGAAVSAVAVGAAGLRASFAAALLNCGSAGVFVYVALVDLLADEVRDAAAPDVMQRAGVFLIATTAMSALAVWV